MANNALLDVFDDDAFSVVELTAAVDKLPYQPARIGAMKLFQSSPTTSSVAVIEERLGTLSLLPTAARGATGQSTERSNRRKVRAIPIPHVPDWDTVLAADLQDKRAFGMDTSQAEVFATILNDRFEQMKQNHEVTREYHRVGALHGIVLDADGVTEILDLFDTFGVTETEIEFNFYDPGTYDQAEPVDDMKQKCAAVYRAMQSALGATPFSGIHCFAGDTWFDEFVKHATVRKAFEAWQNNSFARTNNAGDGTGKGAFEFGGITFENYRGQVGSVKFFGDEEARFFPIGTRNVFLEIPAPADFVETVNTRGQVMYAKQERMKWDKGVELHTQSNVLYLCTRPGCLLKGTYLNEAPGT